MTKKIKILRSAVGSSPSLGLIKELQANNFEIIGLDCDPNSFGLFYLEKGYVIPLGKSEQFIPKLKEIIEKEKPQAILQGPEEEMEALAMNKKALKELGMKVLLPDIESVKICTDKLETKKLFDKINIPQPETYSETNIKFPCILKPKKGRGGTGIYKIESKSEYEILKNREKDYIIQEFVDGEEYTVDLLSGNEGEVLSIVPRKRVCIESGVVSKAITCNDEEIIKYCKKISQELKLFGPSCIQCIKGKNGVKFLEINLRFGGGSILSVKSDPSFIENLKALILEEPVKTSKGFKENLMMLRNYQEIYVQK